MPNGTATSGFNPRRFVRFPSLLRLGIWVGIVLSAIFAWLYSHTEKWDTPAPLPTLIICELPMLACIAALRTGETSKRNLRVAGISFGVALSFCLLSLPMACAAEFTDWGNHGGYLAAFAAFLLPCLAFSFWLLVVTWRFAKGQEGFVTCALAGIGCVVLVCCLINATEVRGSGEAKANARFQHLTPHPDSHVGAIAACLIRHHILHPDEGFPSSLEDIPSDWNCASNLRDPWALQKYWIYYFPVEPSPRGFQDFRIASIFTDDSAWLVAAADKRGEVLQLQGAGLSIAERKKREIPLRTVDGEGILWMLFNVRDAVKTYMNGHDVNNAPQSLDGIIDFGKLPSSCHDGENPQDIVVGQGDLCYDLRYLPPRKTPMSEFAISLQCVSYGNGCVRSYFLDYGGTIHATAEPRAATNEDLGLLQCEISHGSGQQCDDPVWAASGGIPQWAFTRAKLLSIMHSATW